MKKRRRLRERSEILASLDRINGRVRERNRQIEQHERNRREALAWIAKNQDARLKGTEEFKRMFWLADRAKKAIAVAIASRAYYEHRTERFKQALAAFDTEPMPFIDKTVLL